MNIPSVRALLEDAAARGTRNSEVYLALKKIHSEDARRTEEAELLAQKSAEPPVPSPSVLGNAPAIEPQWQSYAQGSDKNVGYQLLAASDSRPHLQTLVPPYYPADLIDQKLRAQEITLSKRQLAVLTAHVLEGKAETLTISPQMLQAPSPALRIAVSDCVAHCIRLSTTILRCSAHRDGATPQTPTMTA